jgi:hypothetical protein
MDLQPDVPEQLTVGMGDQPVIAVALMKTAAIPQQ